MATAHSSGPHTLEKLSWYLEHCPHSAWDSFSTEQQQRMVEEDLLAGKSVSLVLASLITTGMVLCIATLVIVLTTI